MVEKKVLIILPAYNEEKSIGAVIDKIRKLNKQYHLVVINDGSTDKTIEIAQRKKTEVINLPFNLGIGGSVQTGLKYAYLNNYDIAVQVDTDGQHNPKYLPSLIRSLSDNTDMVIGSRFIHDSSYKSNYIRKLGIEIFSFLIRLTCGKKIYDSTSGYRVFNKKAIAFLSKNYPIDFPEPESIVKLLKHGFRIKEIPVEMNQRQAGQSSVTPFKAIFFMSSISVAIIIESIREKQLNYE